VKVARSPLRTLLRFLCLAAAALTSWQYRWLLDPDGICYVDIAKAYLRHDWQTALSSYWSPLFSWLLAGVFGVVRPSALREIPLVHAVMFLGFAGGVACWEWLKHEWEQWKGPAAHPVLWDCAGYACLFWAGTHMQTLVITTPDVLLLPAFLASAAIQVRFRAGKAGMPAATGLGIVLGLGFLAKAAFLPAIAVLLLSLTWSGATRRQAGVALLSLLATVLPFLAAVSLEKGRPVLSDSGRLNYSWVVNGFAVDGYKEGVRRPPPGLAHPARVVFEEPLVLSYDQHILGTIPAHLDPSWWSEGYPVEFDAARQTGALESGVATSLWHLAGLPAVFLAALILTTGGRRSLGPALDFTSVWWIWLPPAGVIAAYCMVFVQERYLAAPMVLLGFALLAASAPFQIPQRLLPAVFGLFLAAFACTAYRELNAFVPAVRELFGRIDNPLSFVPTAANNLKNEGMKPGDRVAIIGDQLSVPWLELAGGSVVAAIPASVRHDEEQFDRPLRVSFERPTAFWRSEPAVRSQILETLKGLGARYVIARPVPETADLDGWIRLSGEDAYRVPGFRTGIYLKRLGP